MIDYRAALLLGLLATLPAPAAAADVALPDMGESSADALSAAEELRIGRDMLRDLRRKGLPLDDPEVGHYIQSLGFQLVSAGEPPRNRPAFFVVKLPEINAFAMPGGYIGVNAGLILAARSEAELAAVLAHELAHVSQRHIARTVEQARSMNLPLTAALIAAIVLGSQDPQAAQAAIATTMASQTQLRLDSSREAEQEADRVGIELLAGAGFEPRSMAGFFERLHRESRYQADTAPEFLRTHPVTEARIADAQNRAEQMASTPRPDSAEFQLIKARLEVLTSDDLPALRRKLESRLADRQVPEATRYAYALTLSAQGHNAEAAREIARLREKQPERIAYLAAAARIELGRNRTEQALALLDQALALYPNNPVLTVTYAEAALAYAGPVEPAAARLRAVVNEGSQVTPTIYRLLATAEAKLGHDGASHLAQAEYYYTAGDLHDAIDQLETALKDRRLDYYTASRVQARLEDLRKESKEAAHPR